MAIDTVLQKINKKYGDGTLVFGNQLTNYEVPRVTTGSLAFDLALGGGWPLNQWHEIVGNESSGKTVVALKTVAVNQALDPKYTAVWVAAEALPLVWAEKLGVDLSRFIIHDTNAMEECFDAVIEFLDSREVDCIVIDSLPALVPAVEDEQMMADFTVGAHARLTGKFTRKGGKATKRSLTTPERPVLGLLINQWRSKIGVTHGDSRTTPGGLAKNFFFFTRTEFRRSEWIDHDDERIGQRIAARVFKNKSAPGQRVGEVDFYFADGGVVPVGSYDSLAEIINLGIASSAIERRGRYYDFMGERIADSRDALFAHVRAHDDLAEKIRNLVLYGEVPVKKTKSRVRKKSG